MIVNDGVVCNVGVCNSDGDGHQQHFRGGSKGRYPGGVNEALLVDEVQSRLCRGVGDIAKVAGERTTGASLIAVAHTGIRSQLVTIEEDVDGPSRCRCSEVASFEGDLVRVHSREIGNGDGAISDDLTDV